MFPFLNDESPSRMAGACGGWLLGAGCAARVEAVFAQDLEQLDAHGEQYTAEPLKSFLPERSYDSLAEGPPSAVSPALGPVPALAGPLTGTPDNEVDPLRRLAIRGGSDAAFSACTGRLRSTHCLLYTSPSPRDSCAPRMPSSACKNKN